MALYATVPPFQDPWIPIQDNVEKKKHAINHPFGDGRHNTFGDDWGMVDGQKCYTKILWVPRRLKVPPWGAWSLGRSSCARHDLGVSQPFRCEPKPWPTKVPWFAVWWWFSRESTPGWKPTAWWCFLSTTHHKDWWGQTGQCAYSNLSDEYWWEFWFIQTEFGPFITDPKSVHVQISSKFCLNPENEREYLWILMNTWPRFKDVSDLLKWLINTMCSLSGLPRAKHHHPLAQDASSAIEAGTQRLMFLHSPGRS